MKYPLQVKNVRVTCVMSLRANRKSSFLVCICFFFKQKTAYEMRISDWSSDVCSSDLLLLDAATKDQRFAGIVSELTHRISRDQDRKPFEGWTLPGEDR